MSWPIPLAMLLLDSREMDHPLLGVHSPGKTWCLGAEVRAKHDHEHKASPPRIGVLEHTGKGEAGSCTRKHSGSSKDLEGEAPQSVVRMIPVSSIVHRHKDIGDHFRDGY